MTHEKDRTALSAVIRIGGAAEHRRTSGSVELTEASSPCARVLQTAVKAFNEAAVQLGRSKLMIEDVLTYASLGEFDLLRISS